MITTGLSWSITGPLLFYGGIVLLGVTVLLAGFFWLKRPRSVPGNSLSGADADPGMRKGEPAREDLVTVFDEAAPPDGESPDTVFPGQTALLDLEEDDGRTVLEDTALERLPSSLEARHLNQEASGPDRIKG